MTWLRKVGRQVFYHGTSEQFDEFKPGTVWVSPDPNFSEVYSGQEQGAHIRPVYVTTDNIWDYENPEHVRMLAERVGTDGFLGIGTQEELEERLAEGDYRPLETNWEAIRDLGFDGYRMFEGGVKNMALFDSKFLSPAFQAQGMYKIAKDAEGHDQSCVMMLLSQESSKRVLDWAQENIPDEWVDEEQGGREDKPHCTLLFAPSTNDLEDIREHLPVSPIDIEFGKVKRFEQDGYDVLYMEMIGDELHEAHHKLAEFPNEDSHPEYKPHCTLSYVKKGAGQEIEGSEPLKGKEKLVKIWWSAADGENEELDLEDDWHKHEAWLKKAEEEYWELGKVDVGGKEVPVQILARRMLSYAHLLKRMAEENAWDDIDDYNTHIGQLEFERAQLHTEIASEAYGDSGLEGSNVPDKVIRDLITSFAENMIEGSKHEAWLRKFY